MRVRHVCADAVEGHPSLGGRFHAVLAVGFLATLYGPQLTRLLGRLWSQLEDGGILLKMTWHEPKRDEAENQAKIRYRYDAVAQPSPKALAATIADAGFRIEEQTILKCDPELDHWGAIQVCLCRKEPVR